jgi:spermidine/putrescine ABC transporter ATP-binding subunit
LSNSIERKPVVRLMNVSKTFGTFTALDDISLDIYEGEFLFLLGPSGSGKTTTLRLIGGYESPSKGTIEIAGKVVNDVPVNKRDIGMVFQNYALFPHKTVLENVGFGLKMRKVPKRERREKVGEVLDLVKLTGLENRYPRQLSGGQQQRVALARAIVYRPSLLILDEPLANLDRKLRDSMRIELKSLQEKVGITTIFVTHDQEEALTMADRIVVMDRGKLIQTGSPSNIYNHPKSSFVANFIGETNFFRGEIIKITDESIIVGMNGGWQMEAHKTSDFNFGDWIELSVRPERIMLCKDKDKSRCCRDGSVEALPTGQQLLRRRDNAYDGVIEFATYLGSQVMYMVRLNEQVLLKVSQPTPTGISDYRVGDKVHVCWNSDQVVCLSCLS